MAAGGASDGGMALHGLWRAGGTPPPLDSIPNRSHHQASQTRENQRLRMRDVEGIEDARRTCRRHNQRPQLAMGEEPNTGTDHGQRNESLNNIKQRSLKLPQRSQAERCADGGKKRQTASRSSGQSADNSAKSTELVKMKFQSWAPVVHAT